MKPTTRRLGQGLGAFLDFAPAGDDGAPCVCDVIASESATSVLATSARPAAPVPVPAAPRAAPQQKPAPVPVAGVPAPPVAGPAAEPAPPPSDPDSAFEDEFVVGLSFPDVELE